MSQMAAVSDSVHLGLEAVVVVNPWFSLVEPNLRSSMLLLYQSLWLLSDLWRRTPLWAAIAEPGLKGVS